MYSTYYQPPQTLQYFVNYPQPQSPHRQPAATLDVITLLNQILKTQTQNNSELPSIRTAINRKIDVSHAALSSKLEQLTSRVQFLESHQANSSTVEVTEQLLGKVIQNPREYNVSSVELCYENDTPMVLDTNTIAAESNFEKGETCLKKAKIKTEVEVLETILLDSTPRQSAPRRLAEKTKRPKVYLAKCSKPSDYLTKAPMYEEVIDGKSLESLFGYEEGQSSPPEEFNKLPMLDLGPHNPNTTWICQWSNVV